MELSWKVLPCDNLRLCQFMASYELREQDYLVALDTQDNILAAGLLVVDGCDAHIDVVVSDLHRRRGIGQHLVTKLVAQANVHHVERLTSHGQWSFWRALGFEQLELNKYCLLLPAAANALVATWHRGIPVTKFLALAISKATPHRIETSASMSKSINVHQSMFAGAIYSQAVLTGWGLIHLRAQQAGVDGSIVLASGDIKYRKPITQHPKGVVEHFLALDNFSVVTQGKKLRIELAVDMFEGDSLEASAQFIGRYVILPKA